MLEPQISRTVGGSMRSKLEKGFKTPEWSGLSHDDSGRNTCDPGGPPLKSSSFSSDLRRTVVLIDISSTSRG
ncbi:hypothetical protein L1987_58321 [Smallanthus sonchifolius]|uniref:Uncharacterized protein n=1 Tax=Smallanthus sonchifolius TaxID=185202 RepID=A0ACB9DFF3_9ASTR|nr:hypothetical protein L1987_58321 [Smallanthus sonchifolius]